MYSSNILIYRNGFQKLNDSNPSLFYWLFLQMWYRNSVFRKRHKWFVWVTSLLCVKALSTGCYFWNEVKVSYRCIYMYCQPVRKKWYFLLMCLFISLKSIITPICGVTIPHCENWNYSNRSQISPDLKQTLLWKNKYTRILRNNKKLKNYNEYSYV